MQSRLHPVQQQPIPDYGWVGHLRPGRHAFDRSEPPILYCRPASLEARTVCGFSSDPEHPFDPGHRPQLIPQHITRLLIPPADSSRFRSQFERKLTVRRRSHVFTLPILLLLVAGASAPRSVLCRFLSCPNLATFSTASCRSDELT